MDPPAEKPNNSMDERFANFHKERYCYNVAHLPYESRCDYVRSSPDCYNGMLFFNYVEAVLCEFKIKSKFEELFPIFLLIILVTIYINIILTVADKYFVPALKVIANKLYMSEHTTGATIVAFCCSCSNLFSNISSMDSETPLLANTLAAGLLVLLISGGLICYMTPFHMSANSTIVLLLFFILGCVYLDYTIAQDGFMKLEEAIIFILIYVGFIAVAIADILLLYRQVSQYRKELKELQKRPVRDKKREEEIERAIFVLIEHEGTELKAKDAGKEGGHPAFTTGKQEIAKRKVVDAKATRIALYHPSNSRNRHLLSDFLDTLSPIDLTKWGKANWLRKIIMIFRIPIVFLCHMIIPRVDVEESKHAWTKLLNIMHCVITPSILLMLVLASLEKKRIFWYLELNWLAALYPLVITVPIACLVFSTSRTDLPPSYHFLFAIISVMTSMVILFICSVEIDQLSNLISTVLSFSEGFIGVTINALGSSVGDLVINVTMACQGYEQIAFAASIGSPFFNIVLSIGVVYLIKSSRARGGFKMPKGLHDTIVFVFLLLALSTMLLWTTILNFQSRRSIGIFSLTLYSIFVIMVILIEAEIIHTWEPDEIIPMPDV